MNINIYTLLHLVAISFAVGLAYIALDRFRYTHRAKTILLHALKKVNDGIKTCDPAAEDTTIIRLKNKIKDISENGLGMKIFYKYGPRTFGVGYKSGWDIYVVSFFLILNFISLCLGCFFIDNSYEWLHIKMFIIAVIGTIFPMVFIYRGKRHISIITVFINDEVETVARMYSLSVAEFKDSMRNLPYM